MNRLGRRLLLVSLLGVALYAGFVVVVGFEAIAGVLATFEWWAFAGALGLAFANYVARFLRWQYYLALLGVRGVRPLDSFLVFLSGFVLTVTPGKVGEVFKSAVLARTHGVELSRTAPVVVAERLTDVLAIVLLVLAGSLGFAGGLVWAIAGGLLVVAGLALVLWEPPLAAFLAYAERSTLLKAAAPKLRTAAESLRRLASPRALLLPTLLAAIGWGGESYGLALIVRGFGEHPPVALTMFFFATSTLAGAVLPLPGGLGVAEPMLQGQMVELAQVPLPTATAAMLLTRTATLWFAVLVGFIALGLLRLRFSSLAARAG